MTKKKFGFTLVEVLVVIAIIGLQAGLIAVYFRNPAEKARDAKRLNDLNLVGRYLNMGCVTPEAGAGIYDLNDLIAEYSAKYPQYVKLIPKNLRDPKTGTETVSNYKYIVTAENKCLVYGNLEDPGADVTLPTLSAPTPGGGKGVFEGTMGWNGSKKYFQVSN